MGMNYFVRFRHCQHCGRGSELHIGKSSYGWRFLFRGHPDKGLTTWENWRDFLDGKRIVDESERDISFEDFCRKVQDKQQTKTHLMPGAVNCLMGRTFEQANTVASGLDVYSDEQGFEFRNGEFS